LASLAGLALGVVLGPEAPLIALGGGLGVLAVRMVRREAPRQVAAVLAAAGSFAAISALLGHDHRGVSADGGLAARGRDTRAGAAPRALVEAIADGRVTARGDL
jgi:hypothetical protein